MDQKKLFRSLVVEFRTLKDRVRFLLGRQWQSDGAWKESVLRMVLKRHLPDSIGVGTGFVVGNRQGLERQSTQIDLLLYDKALPVLFRDGDFVIVTPDSALGVIEVKATARANTLRKELLKLSDNAAMINEFPRDDRPECFFGYFAYALENGLKGPKILELTQFAAEGIERRKIRCVSCGERDFIRYTNEEQPAGWYSFGLPRTAKAYFVFNVVEHLCSTSVIRNNDAWFPQGGKNPYLTGMRSLAI